MNQSGKQKKNVFITGCSTGIGRAMALAFHERGYKVWATARRVQTLDALAEQGISTASLDVTREDQVQNVVHQILDEDGKIDVLINNAGYGGMGPVIETSGEELERQFNTNVFGAMAVVRAVAPTMKEQQSGTIVNIGSISGVLVTPFSGSYCASKAAINALSDALRIELKPFGIKVVTVQPGAVRSSFADNAGKALDRVWSDQSWYKPIEEKVRGRAAASQNNPTEAEDFCRTLINKLETGKELNIVRLANGSRVFACLNTFVPRRLLEKGLAKFFGLDQLNR